MFGLTSKAHKPKPVTLSDVSFALNQALAYEAKAAKAKTLTEYTQCMLAFEHWQSVALDYERQALA